MFWIWSVVSICLHFTFNISAYSTRKSYEGYVIVDSVPKNEDEVKFLQDFMLEDDQIDVLSEASDKATFMVSSDHIQYVIDQLQDADIHFTIVNDNVQNDLDATWRSIDRASRSAVFNLEEFNTLPQIYKWLKTTATKCPNSVKCEVYSIGKSFRGNPINVFKMSKPGIANRKSYWIDATIHAREWIATATALNIINHLVHGGDLDAKELLDEYDWYILPVMNPDGYLYTFTHDRYWRKNRRPNEGSECVGTDLNRNYDFHWGTEGVSHSPCSQVYCGPYPGSEPETAAVMEEAKRIGHTLNAWLTLHSFGKMWMFPYATTVNFTGETCQRVPDHQDLMDVANIAADAVGKTYKSKWKRGNSCEVIYPAAGGTDDYVKAVAGVKYAFVAELRGDYFSVDKSEIRKSFYEIWNGVKAMCKAIKNTKRF